MRLCDRPRYSRSLSSSSSTASVQFRRSVSYAIKNMPNETTALLGVQQQQDHLQQQQQYCEESFAACLRRFLFNRRSTPGTDSDNVLVRWLARIWHIVKITILSNYVNFLLIFVPVGIFAGHNGWKAELVFTFNFLAIIPLAAVLSFATEEISEKLGDTLGGLLNATFGNAVELIVSIIALKAGEIQVVQASILGSILSNLLLVMGMCFLLGGLSNMRGPDGRGIEQKFSSATAQTTCTLMTLSSASMIIPASLYGILNAANSTQKESESSVLLLSRGTAIILLLLYCMYLFFQLRTHKNLFSAVVVDQQHPERAPPTLFSPSDLEASLTPRPSTDALPHLNTAPISTITSRAAEHSPPTSLHDTPTDSPSSNTFTDPSPAMSPWAAAAVLAVATLIIAICAEYLVYSIDPIVVSAHLSKSFIGLILIPIVGNAAEHVTACVVAVRNKMDLAMGVAIGSSIQIALLVTPALVLLGWAMDQPMSLHFETFETIAFALSVLIVTYVVQDGKCNYLEGAMLLGLYVIIALAFWASPPDALQKLSATLMSIHLRH